MADTLLDVVNENDEVIGQELRSVIHAKGLLHREVHVWFVTKEKEIVFGIRPPIPPLYPFPILDATAGGHVELGDSYLQAALRETLEETGKSLDQSALIPYKKVKVKEEFPDLKIINNIFRSVYIYALQDDVSTLQIEQGKGTGFMKVSAEILSDGAADLKKRFFFIPYLLERDMIDFYREIKNG